LYVTRHHTRYTSQSAGVHRQKCVIHRSCCAENLLDEITYQTTCENGAGQRVENKLTKYGHFTPAVVVYPYEIERLRPTDWRHLQDCVPVVEGGRLDAYQLDTATVTVYDPLPKSATGVALYARVSSVDQKNDLERQMERLTDYAAAQGYHVMRMVSQIGSGRNSRRPHSRNCSTFPPISVILLEHRDRGTRFGFTSIEQLRAMQGRRLEVVFRGIQTTSS
jgi:hypothetical protein